MQSVARSQSRKYYPTLLHVFFLLILLILFNISGKIKFQLSEKGFLHFDAAWYSDIKDNGYIYKEDVQSNSGFYPAFPYIWKVTQLSPIGISIFNAIIFFISFFFLARAFEFSIYESLLALSVPSLMFNFLPYSEALFFLSATVLLIGLHRRNNLMLYGGLFLCCLVRPMTIVFIPVLLFVEFASKKEDHNGIINIIFSIMACVLPFFLVALVQHLQTGVWFAHSKAQIMHWDHEFHIPHFPLSTWVGPKTIWLDGTAFWMGFVATLFCIYTLFNRTSYDRSFMFSVAYLSGVCLFTLFYNGYNDRGSTTLLSLNRYFFATPFFFVVFQKCLRLPQLSNKRYLYLIASLIFIWLLFGAYTEIDWFNRFKTIIYFLMLTAAIIMYILSLNHDWFRKKKFWVLLYIGGCLLQVYLFYRFLSGEWVG